MSLGPVSVNFIRVTIGIIAVQLLQFIHSVRAPAVHSCSNTPEATSRHTVSPIKVDFVVFLYSKVAFKYDKIETFGELKFVLFGIFPRAVLFYAGRTRRCPSRDTCHTRPLPRYKACHIPARARPVVSALHT
jgi:hypothetical protein